MKITDMRQIAKGIQDASFVEKMLTFLDRVKWRLWHGHVAKALWALDWMSDECYSEEKSDARQE